MLIDLGVVASAENSKCLMIRESQKQMGIIDRIPLQSGRTDSRRTCALHLTGAGERIPKSYIYCTRPAPGDVFRQFAERARSETGWRYFEIDASHSPHVTVPASLATLLDNISAMHVK